jgi:hypothetical protein
MMTPNVWEIIIIRPGDDVIIQPDVTLVDVTVSSGGMMTFGVIIWLDTTHCRCYDLAG